MQLQDFISVLAALLTLSISLGLIFAILVQPRRTRVNWYFTLFALSVSVWSAGAIFRNLNQDVVTFSAKTQFLMQVIGLILSVLSFYFFLVSFLHSERFFVKPASYLALPMAVFSTILVLTDDFVHWNGGDWTITLVGYGLAFIGVLYLAGASWLIYKEQTEVSRAMRLPAVLMTLGIAANFVPALSRLPIDTTLRGLVMVLVGWQILRFQVFNPMQEMVHDLKSKNDALRRAADELHAEKARVEELNQRLRQSDQYRSTFLASMSHELRTPLGALIGYSEMLLQGNYGELNDKQNNRIERIHRNALNLLELINDILDLSKIEAGKIELEMKPVALTSLVDTIRSSIEPQAERKNLQFAVVVDENLCPICADEIRIRQVVVNLLSNAIKFTREGGVTLEMQNVPEGVLIRVCDTGIGIAPENHERIFEAFRQADSGTTREYGGTGLGLAIAKRFVEMHRGRIWLESELGKGSTFYVQLPVVKN
ncbi:MAG: HAMP domain-containing histidine kinase [Anaerolineae bacterium]|nr:HAMP domain-containing histidine kinase [Anaerolineae bacterium]